MSDQEQQPVQQETSGFALTKNCAGCAASVVIALATIGAMIVGPDWLRGTLGSAVIFLIVWYIVRPARKS